MTTSLKKDCYNGTTLISSTERKSYGKATQRQISSDKLTASLVATYWKDLDALLQNVQHFHEADYHQLVRIWRKIGNNLLHGFVLLLALILLILFKVLRHRCQRRFDEVERTVFNLNDIIWQWFFVSFEMRQLLSLPLPTSDRTQQMRSIIADQLRCSDESTERSNEFAPTAIIDAAQKFIQTSTWQSWLTIGRLSNRGTAREKGEDTILHRKKENIRIRSSNFIRVLKNLEQQPPMTTDHLQTPKQSANPSSTLWVDTHHQTNEYALTRARSSSLAKKEFTRSRIEPTASSCFSRIWDICHLCPNIPEETPDDSCWIIYSWTSHQTRG